MSWGFFGRCILNWNWFCGIQWCGVNGLGWWVLTTLDDGRVCFLCSGIEPSLRAYRKFWTGSV